MSGIGDLNTFNTAPAASFKTEFLKSTDGDSNNTYEMSVWLYADTAFSTWKAKVDDAANTPTEDEKVFAYDYSDYTIAIKCDVTKVAGNDNAANRAESGCCLRDESQKGGGYCIKIKAD